MILHFTFSGLTRVPSYINPYIMLLDLSGNQISSLEKDAFRGFNNLMWLYLQDNQISTVRFSNYTLFL